MAVLESHISVGAFDFDRIAFPTVLRFAKTGEKILLLGDTDPVSYKESELAYFDSTGGYNIDFNFRDSQRTAVTLDTHNIYLNAEGIFDITPYEVERTLRSACENIIRFCGGTITDFGMVIS
jgi:DNA/RNA-binding domain of Phe-tRNA-synthetase-like protein